jgi:hypothetical protein
MPRGRTSRVLSPEQIERLETFRHASHEGAPHGYSLPLLRSAMGAGFSWETLQKALQGRPVWIMHHAYIVQWIERFLPQVKDESDKETAPADGTLPEKE